MSKQDTKTFSMKHVTLNPPQEKWKPDIKKFTRCPDQCVILSNWSNPKQ